MQIKLHANAALTPAKRAYVQASGRPVAALVDELGVSERTVRRWKARDTVQDRSSRPKRLQTRFSAEEEAIAAELRLRLALSLDDMLEVMRRCVRPDISRSALHRCLRRLALPAPAIPQKPDVRPFAPEPFGYVHADLKHLPRLQGRPAYVFVAIERTSRFVHVEVVDNRRGDTVAACFQRFLDAFGHPVHTVLTDNGSEFTDRFGDARWRRRTTGTGRHPFDRACAARHRLTEPFHPQTNGMVERFNRRIRDAIAAQPAAGNGGKNRFASHDERNAFLHTLVRNYNRTRLRCLDHKAPAEVLANLTGHNTQAGMTGGKDGAQSAEALLHRRRQRCGPGWQAMPGVEQPGAPSGWRAQIVQPLVHSAQDPSMPAVAAAGCAGSASASTRTNRAAAMASAMARASSRFGMASSWTP